MAGGKLPLSRFIWAMKFSRTTRPAGHQPDAGRVSFPGQVFGLRMCPRATRGVASASGGWRRKLTLATDHSHLPLACAARAPRPRLHRDWRPDWLCSRWRGMGVCDALPQRNCGRFSRPSLFPGNRKRTSDSATLDAHPPPGNQNHINKSSYDDMSSCQRSCHRRLSAKFCCHGLRESTPIRLPDRPPGAV